MLSYKWLILGVYSCRLLGSSSLIEARRLIHSENIEQDLWEDIFDREHEVRPSVAHGRVKSRSIPKPKEKLALKKKEDGKFTSSSSPSIAPTRSPVLSEIVDVEDEEEIGDETEEEITYLKSPIPSMYPSYAPTTQPNLSMNSPPIKPNPDRQTTPLLDFQISLSSQSSSSIDIDRLEVSMETTLRLGMVLLDVKEIQFATTPAQVDSMTYTFSDGSAILQDDDESLEFIQTQQIGLLSDISFVESALQQEMKDPTIRVEDILIVQQNALLPSAKMIGNTDSDGNGVRMVIALMLCLITFCLAALVCYRRYKVIKR